ncbi:MAG: potassium transporter TrkG [Butyribacter sp.]|nr:potassium transporter TrkG [bacterium]MDY3854204.1 potassium transporter TrkG [Butyribacter sp.]
MGTLLKKHQLTSFRIIIIGFAAAILAGCLLLMLPVATKGAGGASFEDALFTSTSAVCVTGLVVQDTATYWSSFGQFVILCLIQIGGMGVITIAVAIAMVSGKKISLMQRSTLQDAISAPHTGGIVRLTGFIIKMTVCFELLGAVLMFPVFCKEFGAGKGIWYSVFHAVSAFCNAGFDLMGIRQQYSSLVSFAGQPVINVVIMLLIIAGGIGFLTWDDIRVNHLHFRKYRLQSKVIITTSGILILLPAIYFFFGEFAELPMGERVLSSLFQAVTPRTAGFNTVDMTMMTQTGIGLIILLMLVGGSPGSTAGGMKTTTLAVLCASSSVFRGKDAHYFGRRIPEETIRSATALLMLYLTFFLAGGLIISRIEGLPLLSCLFETASAIGTVGLSLGITTKLGLVSRGILIFLMYVGRVGGLTLIYAAVSGTKVSSSKLPQEKITVG